MIKSKKFSITISALLAVTIVSGCSQIQSITGKGKNPPDEFAVVERPSLVIPPNYNLAPPIPGEPSPQDLASAPDTLRALFPDRENVVPQISDGEAVLLRNIEAAPLSEVRSEVGDLGTEVVEKGTLLDEIMDPEEREGELDNSDVKHISSEDEDG